LKIHQLKVEDSLINFTIHQLNIEL